MEGKMQFIKMIIIGLLYAICILIACIESSDLHDRYRFIDRKETHVIRKLLLYKNIACFGIAIFWQIVKVNILFILLLLLVNIITNRLSKIFKCRDLIYLYVLDCSEAKDSAELEVITDRYYWKLFREDALGYMAFDFRGIWTDSRLVNKLAKKVAKEDILQYNMNLIFNCGSLRMNEMLMTALKTEIMPGRYNYVWGDMTAELPNEVVNNIISDIKYLKVLKKMYESRSSTCIALWDRRIKEKVSKIAQLGSLWDSMVD